MSGVCWGLTPLEQCKLRLKDVMDCSGDFYQVWTLPAHGSYTGIARELRTEDQLLPFLEDYMRWWKEKGLHPTTNHSYRGLDPDVAFILSDRYEAYALSKRVPDGPKILPVTMNKKLNQLISNAGVYGARASTFRDSFIKAMYDNGCHHNELLRVTGIKDKATIDKRIAPHERALEDVFENIFSRVK
jgi:hypothetical protein